MKHRQDKLPSIGSDIDQLMEITGGFGIYLNIRKKSGAYADENYFVLSEDFGDLNYDDNGLFFAGGEDDEFGLIDIEVWGLN